MNRFFTLLFAAACLTAVGQVPEYVPAEGLVAWYPLDGNGLDAGPSGLNGTEYGSVPTDSRNGEADAAIMLDGESHINLGDSPSLNPEDALTFSAWFRLDEPNAETGSSTILGRNTNGGATNRYCYYFSVVYMDGESKLSFGLENDSNGYPLLIFDVPATINLDQWHHYAATYASTSGLMKVYLDGMFVSEWNVGAIAVNQIITPTLIGFYRPNGDHSFTGAIDDLGVWNRALVDDEILTLFAEGPSVFGCTDSSACNFNAEANLDDGSCHFLCQYCKEGTVWDEAIQGCVVANPADINFDGCVQLNDLLDLLSAYGSCFVWQCGDPLEYQGYDYATVQIGEQCWFAENLRTEKYSNGQSIFNGVESAEWWSSEAYEGAYCLYGQGNSPCEFYGDEDVCMDSSDSIFLYNWYAVDNPSSLCPSGWSVPSDSGWMELETFLGMAEEELSTIGFRGGELGHVLKSSTLWLDPNTGEIQGEDVIGFNAVPAGQRSTEGAFSVYGHDAQFWTSTPNPISEDGICRSLHSNAQGIYRRDSFSLKWMGKSVRCIKDAE